MIRNALIAMYILVVLAISVVARANVLTKTSQAVSTSLSTHK